MPVSANSYRGYAGQRAGRLQCVIILAQEWKVLRHSRMFLALLILCMLQPFVRLMQVLVNSVIYSAPQSVLAPLLENAGIGYLNHRMMVEYCAIQTGVCFLLLLYAGAGTICNEKRNNLLDVYFASPIRWSDYALGKALAHIALGFAVLALPGLGLIAVHALLMPGFHPPALLMRWTLGMFLQGLLIVVPIVMSILAASAWIRSQGFAAVTVIAIAMAATTLGGTLTALTKNSNFLALSFPMSLNRLAEVLFGDRALGWYWPLFYVLGTTVAFSVLFFLRTWSLEQGR